MTDLIHVLTDDHRTTICGIQLTERGLAPKGTARVVLTQDVTSATCTGCRPLTRPTQLVRDLVINLAHDVRRSATARIGSAQRRNHAEEARVRAAKLGMTPFAAEATSAALLAAMVAQAWNENKAANSRRLRWANRNLAAVQAAGGTWGDVLDSHVGYRYADLDTECRVTFDAANGLRAQAIEASRKLTALVEG